MGAPISGPTLVADLLRSARLIGYANSLRAVRNAVQRVWRDARDGDRGSVPASRHPDRTVRTGWGPAGRVPGALRTATPRPGGARFGFAAATLDVVLLSGGGARLEWFPTGVEEGADEPAPHPPADGAVSPSYAVPGTGPDLHPDAWLEAEGPPDDGWVVGAGTLAVRVGRRGGLSFERLATPGDSHGTVVRRDEPPLWIGSAWTQCCRLEPGAAVLGLGGRGGPLNRRPGGYRLWNTEPGGSYGRQDDPLSICMPVSLVIDDSGGHLAFFDVTYDGTVEVTGPTGSTGSTDPGGSTGSEGTLTTRLVKGPLRYYVLTGAPAELLDRFTALTGRPAVPPRWALGYHQSRWGYGNEETLREVVRGFAEHDVPLSALWLDIDHLVDHQVFTVDQARYPDLAGFAAEARQQGIHLVSIIDPGVKAQRGVDLYESGLDAGAFCCTATGELARGVAWPGTTVYPDFTSPATRDWWGEQYAELLERGIDGVWHDMNEPSSFVAFGEPTLPLSTRHDLDGYGGDHREAHNVYGLTMNQAGYEALLRHRPDQRPFLLSRAGWTGMQRYGGTWTGDIETSWHGLSISLAFTLGLGLCGVPFSGPDIGGFTRHPTPELYRRWFQLAAYLPFCRTHCAGALPDREPWDFGPQVLDHVRALLHERYRLLPYWYTLAWQAHRTGAPYARPLLWDAPTDPELRLVDDAFLFGDAFLVAPVLGPGVRQRRVRLPAGRWYDRWRGTAFDGPGWVEVAAPLDVVPVFVRAGAVVPVEEDGEIVLEAYHPRDDAGTVPGAVVGGGVLITDEGGGWAEPVEERFTMLLGPDGAPRLGYDGPADALPYPVRWRP